MRDGRKKRASPNTKGRREHESGRSRKRFEVRVRRKRDEPRFLNRRTRVRARLVIPAKEVTCCAKEGSGCHEAGGRPKGGEQTETCRRERFLRSRKGRKANSKHSISRDSSRHRNPCPKYPSTLRLNLGSDLPTSFRPDRSFELVHSWPTGKQSEKGEGTEGRPS
jgi:hypothetical protein